MGGDLPTVLQRPEPSSLTPQQQRALELNLLGILVVAILSGDKRPSHKWKDIVAQTADDVLRLITPDVERIGAICGARSNGFTMFEFEAEAVRRGLDKRYVELLEAEPGGPELWARVRRWQERSASGGRHLHWFCPEDPQPNTQLAADANNQVLIETRGEGGQVVVAPSGSHISGQTDDQGRPIEWTLKYGHPNDIATISADEQRLLFAIARKLNERPEQHDATEPVLTVTEETPADNVRHLDNRIDDYIQDFNRKPWAEVLAPAFTHVRDVEIDGRTVGYWKFNGQKSPIGAYTNYTGNNTLIVFSGTAKNHGWEIYTGASQTPSYDKFSAWAKIRHKGDRMKALYEIGFRTQAQLDEDLGINKLAKSPIQRQAEQELEDPPDGTSAAVENDEPVDPDMHQANWIFDLKWIAELGLNAMFDLSRAIGLIPPVPHVGDDLQLPDQFWSSRPILQHLSQAADNALVPRDALLGATLGIVGAHTDWRYVLPPFGDRGRIGALNVHIGLVGQSGAGKGSAIDLGHDLLRPPHQEGHRVRRVPAGSGEGMVKAFFELQKDDDDKRRYVLKKAADSVFIEVQEGEFLKNLAQRQGQTTLQVMRSAWSGEHLGGTYSNEDKNAHLSAHMYRWTMICAVQPSLAGPLLDDEAGGTAQRQLWFSLHNPNITGTSIDPGPLNWKPIRWVGQQPGKKYIDLGDGEYNRTVLTIDIAIHTELRNARIAAIKNSTNTAPGHRNLAKLKTAALLAILEGRTHIRIDDWHLAECIHKVSDNLADMMRQVIASEEQQVARRQGAVDAARQTSRRNEAEWIAGAAVAFGKRVRTKGPQTDNDLKNSLRSDKRGLVETVKHTAVANGWITWDSSSSRWVAGSQEPT